MSKRPFRMSRKYKRVRKMKNSKEKIILLLNLEDRNKEFSLVWRKMSSSELLEIKFFKNKVFLFCCLLSNIKGISLQHLRSVIFSLRIILLIWEDHWRRKNHWKKVILKLLKIKNRGSKWWTTTLLMIERYWKEE